MRTPPRSAELLDTFPELAAHARTATRLHPRPGPVTATGSHVGGPLRWPSADPWPVCTSPITVFEEVPLPRALMTRLRQAEARRVQSHVLAAEELAIRDEIAAFAGPTLTGWSSTNDGPVVAHRTAVASHPVPTPLIALAQLRAEDIPDLPRPAGRDLLQILWCPSDHDRSGPVVDLRWRRESDVTAPFADPLDDAPVGDEKPVPCRLHPERVVEYPWHEELPADLQARLKVWDGRGEHYMPSRYLDVAIAPGWKVGGYTSWNATSLLDMSCPQCNGPTRLLFVADSNEFDGSTAEAWQPLDDPDPDNAQEPTRMVIGRWGALRIFACPACPGFPVVTDIQ